MTDTAESWTRAIGAESLLSSWAGTSMLLLANALIFFHMARVRSLEVGKGQAAFVAVVLIAAGVAVQIGSTVVYGQRARRAIQHLPITEQVAERNYHRAILAFCATMCLVLVLIAFVVLRGSWAPLVKLIDGQRRHETPMDSSTGSEAARAAVPHSGAVAAPAQ